MNILGIETSHLKMSIALLGLHQEPQEIVLISKGSESLMSSIESLLARFRVPLKDLDAIAFSQGPGSFTGLRIGASTVKGLCLVCPVPVLTVNSLEVWAANALAKSATVAVAIDAKRGAVYGQAFGRINGRIAPLSNPFFGSIENFIATLSESFVIVGNAVSLYKGAIEKICGSAVISLEENDNRPRALDLVQIAARKITADEAVFINGRDLIPKYLWDTSELEARTHRNGEGVGI